jgi:hypothetical protein
LLLEKKSGGGFVLHVLQILDLVLARPRVFYGLPFPHFCWFLT